MTDTFFSEFLKAEIFFKQNKGDNDFDERKKVFFALYSYVLSCKWHDTIRTHDLMKNIRFSSADAAQHMGISPNTVRSARSSASNRLYSLFGKNVGKTVGASFALIVVWFTTGFWHGASWAYIIWGGLNGLAIILTLWFDPVFIALKKRFHIKESSFGWRAFATLRTFFIVTMIKVFPEVGDFKSGINYWIHCFKNWNLKAASICLLLLTAEKRWMIL